jgi:hypothetical protein
MSKAGKLVKDIVKAKKESVMGKLGDSPYEDPMEPWSAKYAQPVKEEVLNEDGLLMKYIRSLGFNPEFMTFAQRSSYARSNAFKRYKSGHTFDREKQNLKTEDFELDEGKEDKIKQLKQDHATAVHWSKNEKSPQKREAARQKAEKIKRHLETQYKQGVAEGYQDDGKEREENLRYARSRNPVADAIRKKLNPNQKPEKKQPVAEGLSKRDQQDVAAIKAAIERLQSQLQQPNADKAAIQASIAHEKKRLALYGQGVTEEVEQLDEAGTGLLMTFIKSKGLNPLTMDGNQKKAYARSSEFRIFKMRHMKETSGMGERGDDWNEEKKPVKEAVDAKDTVTMDIPLLIRVLEYAREDAKTDMDLHKVVENLINMRGEGALSMDMYNKIVAIKEEIEHIDELKSTTLQSYKTAAHKSLSANAMARHAGEISSKEYHATANKRSKGINRADADKRLGTYADKTPKKLDIGAYGSQIQKQYHSEETEQIDELSSDLLGRYKKAAGAQASAADKAGDIAKGNKRFSGIMKATRKQFDNDAKKVNELKNMPDNMDGDDHITREEKKMKGADPCWKGYQMVGSKKKGGRTVPNCVPEQVTEGIGGIEDSPLSATNSVKAMESEQRKKNLKSARIIKSIYKKKGKNESLYDWEKDDKPAAKITMQGGTTMTGKPRDTVEIEPVLKTRPNSQKQ